MKKFKFLAIDFFIAERRWVPSKNLHRFRHFKIVFLLFLITKNTHNARTGNNNFFQDNGFSISSTIKYSKSLTIKFSFSKVNQRQI